jgi:hypothetical protein
MTEKLAASIKPVRFGTNPGCLRNGRFI